MNFVVSSSKSDVKTSDHQKDEPHRDDYSSDNHGRVIDSSNVGIIRSWNYTQLG